MFFLVVDDDALSRDLLTLLLEVEGYEVEAAVSGEAAILRIAACATQQRPLPDVILTDIQMPGLAGNALAAALRTALSKQTLLFAMSGSQPALSALTGFDGFLLKPFKVIELKAMMEAAAPISEIKTLATKPEEAAQQIESTGGPELTGGPGPDALDEDIYEKMCELMPAAQLAQMYTLCIDDARRRITHMRALAEADDDAQYRREAHAVKGGCGMIGAKELYALAGTAEQAGLLLDDMNPGTTSVTAILAQLSLACDRLERILGERTHG